MARAHVSDSAIAEVIFALESLDSSTQSALRTSTAELRGAIADVDHELRSRTRALERSGDHLARAMAALDACNRAIPPRDCSEARDAVRAAEREVGRAEQVHSRAVAARTQLLATEKAHARAVARARARVLEQIPGAIRTCRRAMTDLTSYDAGAGAGDANAVPSALVGEPSSSSVAGERAGPVQAFRYTDRRLLSSIAKDGLHPGSYATSRGDLSPMQAEIDLALPPNREPRDTVVRVDLAGLRAAGYNVPSFTQVSHGFNRPGGGDEIRFPFAVPPQFVKVVR